MGTLALRRAAASLLLLGLALAATLAWPAAAQARARVAVLIGISASHRHGYDQLVFQFTGGLPTRRTARYVAELPATRTGRPITVVGSVRLLVSFKGATGQSASGGPVFSPAERSYALPDVIQVVTVADHRHELSLGVGLARHERVLVTVRRRPDRVILDVRAAFRTTAVRAYFVNSRSVFGASVTKPADRPVIAPATPARALQRLFAGPTQAELASGLRFVSSGATGFRLHRIRDGVARVQLIGGCSSGGSTITVASEIMPTLEQFPSVRWVKIYDAAGRTTQPNGLSDSIPACLRASTAKLLTARYKGPFLLIIGLLSALGILTGLVICVLALLGGLGRRAKLTTPTDYRAERLREHPAGPGDLQPDAAWPLYPVRQARTDIRTVEAERRRLYRRLWQWPGRPLLWIVLFPLSLAALAWLIATGLTTVLVAAVFTLVTWICAAAIGAVCGLGVTVLRAVEAAWHRLMRTEASCPQCYLVTPRPAYRCPACEGLHRDVRPGRLGVLTRRCECGRLLPTMVLRAAWRLEAVCQRCGEPLRLGSAALRDVRIAIFGDVSAGKTRLLYSGLDSLAETATSEHVRFGYTDEESEQQASTALAVIRSSQQTAKTATRLPTAISCRLGKGPRTALVHLFDVAGELYRGAEMHDALGFLDRAHGLAYVLDPFAVSAVRDRLAGQDSAVLQQAHPAAGDPETAYTEVVSRLRDSGVEAAGQSLAVVVSKADLLREAAIELPNGSAAIADWLRERGLHNLVLSARREFADVRYFAVASVAATGGNGGYDPGAPIRWLLAQHGVKVGPGSGRPIATTRVPRSRAAPHDDLTFTEPDQPAEAQP